MIWSILEQMNYYFLTYLYIWIPTIIISLALGWYWDKTHEGFEETKKHKHIIKIMGSDITSLTLIQTKQEKKFIHNDVAYLIHHGSRFKLGKKGFRERLSHNWFMDKIPLRWLKKIIKSWDWYGKYQVLFEEYKEEETKTDTSKTIHNTERTQQDNEKDNKEIPEGTEQDEQEQQRTEQELLNDDEPTDTEGN